MARRNQKERGSPAQVGKRLAQTALIAVGMTALIVGFVAMKTAHDVEMFEPKFELVDFKDASQSFTETQMKEVLGLHDEIYEASFGGSPVQYTCYAFAENLVEVGSAVTVSPDETWPILDRVAPVKAFDTRFAPAVEHAMNLAKAKPKRVFAVLFQSDGGASDWVKLDQAAKKLAKVKNVAFVAVTGATPECRIRLRKAMEPMGDRFLACDPADTNAATATKLANLVKRTRGNL